ncbi:hypothetical protein ACFSTC_16360 [Nonomuraea ferruginea]
MAARRQGDLHRDRLDGRVLLPEPVLPDLLAAVRHQLRALPAAGRAVVAAVAPALADGLRAGPAHLVPGRGAHRLRLLRADRAAARLVPVARGAGAAARAGRDRVGG